MGRLLGSVTPENQEVQASQQRVRDILFRDKPTSHYYGWVVATFAPWSSIPSRGGKCPKGKSLPLRVVEVARDGIKADNKTLDVLRAAAHHYQEIIDTKNALLAKTLSGTPAEIRQRLGLQIRTWKNDWKLGILLALLQETMAHRDFGEGNIYPSTFGILIILSDNLQWSKNMTSSLRTL